MPIKGLTDRPAAFPRIGEIRKGAPKTDEKRPGKDLTFFRFTPSDPKDTGLARLFAQTVGDKPVNILLSLPYPSVDQNLDAWCEEWTAGSLKHRCDGQRCTLELDESGKFYRQFPIGEGPECPGKCKAQGRLSIIIPALKRAGTITVLTTSKNDLLELSRNLREYESLKGDLRGIPLILSRAPRLISTPGDNGKRVRREKSLLHLEIHPQWFERQLAGAQMRALPTIDGSPLLIEAGYAEDDEDDEPASRQVDTTTGEITDAPEDDDRPLVGTSNSAAPVDTISSATQTSMKTPATTTPKSAPSMSEPATTSGGVTNDEAGQLAYYDKLFAQAQAINPKEYALKDYQRREPVTVARAIKNLKGKLAAKEQTQ